MKYTISPRLTMDMPMHRPIIPPRLATRDITDIVCTGIRPTFYLVALTSSVLYFIAKTFSM